MKHRIALALFATACMAGMSFAADLPVSAPYQPFIVRQPVEWTGLYFGANAGYGWGQYSSNIGSGSPSGAIAGGQIGFNWQAGMAGEHLHRHLRA